MNDAQLIDRLAGTDAYSADVPVPDDIWTPDVALREIERRTGMQTQEQETQQVGGSPLGSKPPRRRWLVPVLAAGTAVVIAVVVAVALLGGDDESDVANSTVPTTAPTTVPESAGLSPLEVAEALDAAIVAGDWEAVLALYSEDATYTHLDDGFGFDAFRHGRGPADYTIRTDMPLTSERFTSGGGMLPGQWEEPLTGDYPPVDWDGEPGITGFDDLATLAMANYAAGVTDFYSCEQVDATTVVCEVVIEGHAFWETPPPVTDIFTIEGGLITHQSYDTTVLQPATDPTGSPRIGYFVWVRDNRPELEQSLFWPEGGNARQTITSETAETHRELIAEWRAQR
jgi:hypothetical protein